jgi:Predicted phosphosugar isomerases
MLRCIMNSLDAMEIGIRSQLQDHVNIRIFKPRKNCLFVGSGDSFAASLAAEYASGFRARCFHPEDILYNPSIVDRRVVYFVSVSGRTKANILAARAAMNRGSRTVAVTASPDSPLAASCDRVIRIKYRKESVSTAGTVSFSQLSSHVCHLLQLSQFRQV